VPSLILLDRHSDSIVNFRQMRTLHAVPIVAVQAGHFSCPEEDDCVRDYARDVDLVVYGESLRVLVARVRAILRRRGANVTSKTQHCVGEIGMNLDRHEVLIKGRAVNLTIKEFEILRQFLESPGHVFTRQELLDRIWGEDFALGEHALDVYIHGLRQKIEQNPASPKFLLTVRGIGYKLRA
jgi:DNA-binding response OmpR family regulator